MTSLPVTCLLLATSLLCIPSVSSSFQNYNAIQKATSPTFTEPIANVTVFMGREAAITCSLKDLGKYQVAWLRAEPDIGTLLSVHTNVIANDPRLRVSHHNHQKWTLHIKDVMESDAGSYMCQLNSEPMMSQTGFLDVLVPPTIVEEETSSDVVADERSRVSLRCSGRGYPPPTITWRREDGQELNLGSFGGKKLSASKLEGEFLNISQVTRDDMAAYLCIISNSVPPSISKRISIQVNFRPKIIVSHQLVGAARGSEALLECLVEAWPHPLTSWIRHDQSLILSNHKYQLLEERDGYRTRMRLKVTDVSEKDFGGFKCVSRNTLAEKEGFIRLYETKVVREVVSSDKHKDESSSRAAEEMDAQNRQKSSSSSGNGNNFPPGRVFVNSSFQRQTPKSSFPYLNPSRRNSAVRRTAQRWTVCSHSFAITALAFVLLSQTIV